MTEQREEPPRLTLFPYPDLFKPCQPIGSFGDDVKKLEELLVKSLRYYEGLGVACNQVIGAGHYQMFVMVDLSDLSKHITVINPTVVEEGKWVSGVEGCLSLPGVVGPVMRKDVVRLQFFDAAGGYNDRTFTELQARVVQHELQHMRGGCIYHSFNTQTKKLNAGHVALLAGPYYEAPWLDRSLKRLVKREVFNAGRRMHGHK